MPLDLKRTCSALQRALGTSPLGTAPSKGAYLVVEHPKPWPAKPKKAALPPALKQALKEHSEKLTLLLTPPAEPGPPRARIYLRRKDRVLYREVTVDRLPEALKPDPGDFQEAPPTLLVCTHGSRDACCARLGVPLLRACREQLSDRAIVECSHLGGHRLAPTCLALPDWRFFGVVDDPSKLVQMLQQGQAHLDIYRGSGCLPGPAQVVEGHLWERLGHPPRSVRLLEWREAGDLHHLLVESDGEGYRAVVRARTRRVPASCGDVPGGKAKAVEDYSLEELTLAKGVNCSS